MNVEDEIKEKSNIKNNDKLREKIHTILNMIPDPDKRVSFEKLSDILIDVNSNKNIRDGFIHGILYFLKTTRAIKTKEENGVLFISTVSEVSKLFITSIAKYIEEDIKIIGDWKRLGSHGDIPISKILPFGTQFLRLLELNRVKESKTPIRYVKVSVALIKAKLRFKKDPVYLFQFEQNGAIYKPIGGKYREGDKNDEETMKREIDEEIHLSYPDDYDLKELLTDVDVTKGGFSRSRGAFTHYTFKLFQISLKKIPKLGPNDKWFSEKELKEYMELGKLQADFMSALESHLPGGLASLPVSPIKAINRPLKEIIKDNIINISIIVGILGIIITLIGLIL